MAGRRGWFFCNAELLAIVVIVADVAGFAVEDALDELYRARPEDFTALRTELAAKAKGSGDAAAAKRIAGSRKPTTAAWVVNILVLDGTARTKLADLGSRLREAHAAMDGEAIRALTAEQRKLVDELARAGFRGAELRAVRRVARRRHRYPAGGDRRPRRHGTAGPADQGRAVVRIRRIQLYRNSFHYSQTKTSQAVGRAALSPARQAIGG